MSKYTGGRIVPRHDGTWDSTKEYEQLTIVLNTDDGVSYMSRKKVPAGTELSDEEYWVVCSQFSRQVQILSNSLDETDAEVETLKNQVAANVTASTDSDADYAAEVADARVDHDGSRHTSLGEHIREVTGDMAEDIEDIQIGARVSFSDARISSGEEITTEEKGLLRLSNMSHEDNTLGYYFEVTNSSMTPKYVRFSPYTGLDYNWTNLWLMDSDGVITPLKPVKLGIVTVSVPYQYTLCFTAAESTAVMGSTLEKIGDTVDEIVVTSDRTQKIVFMDECFWINSGGVVKMAKFSTVRAAYAIPAKQGDTFRLRTQGTGNAYSYYVTDENQNVLSQWDASAYDDELTIEDEDAAYLYVNSLMSYTDFLCYYINPYGAYLPLQERVETLETEMEKTQADIEALQESLDELTQNAEIPELEAIEIEILSGARQTNGYIFADGNSISYSHAVVTEGFTVGEYVYVTGQCHANAGYPAIAFFDEDDTLISSLYGEANASYVDEKVLVPDGTAYLVINGKGTSNNTISLKIAISVMHLQEVYDALDKRLSAAEEICESMASEGEEIAELQDLTKIMKLENVEIEILSGARSIRGGIFADGDSTSYSHAVVTDGFTVGEYVYVTGQCHANTSYPALAFYDEGDTLLSSLYGEADASYVDEKVLVPEGTSYLVINGKGTSNNTISLKIEVGAMYLQEVYDELNDRVDTLETESRDTDSILAFEEECLADRCYKQEQTNPFCYAEMDKAYIVLTIDDGNSNLPKMYDLCHALGIPLSPAIPPSTLTNKYTTGYDYESDSEVTVDARTVQEILEAVVADGGEVLSHNGKVITLSSDTERFLLIFRDSKKTLEEAGFTIRGIILSGGTDSETGESSTSSNAELNKKCHYYSSRYYDYSDLYGVSEPFRHTRFYMWSYSSIDYYDNLITNLDKKIAEKGLIVIGMHGSTSETSLEQVTYMRKILEYVQENHADDVEFTTWAAVYDAFKSTSFEERLKALEG